MIWRIRFSIMGGHIHCSLYVADAPNRTFAKCGDFNVRKGEEFRSLMEQFSTAQFIGQQETDGTVEAMTS